MLSLIRFQGSFWILDVKNSEVEILLVEIFKFACINLVLQLGDP
jgi:hypothetical protein